MSSSTKLAMAVGAVVAAVAITSPAHAQCRLCDQPTTQAPTDGPDGDVQLQIETKLDFDRLINPGRRLSAG